MQYLIISPVLMLLLVLGTDALNAQNCPGFWQRLFSDPQRIQLETHRWPLVSLDGDWLPLPFRQSVFLEFDPDAGQIRGQGFCQPWAGSYRLRRNQGLDWEGESSLPGPCPGSRNWEQKRRTQMRHVNRYMVNGDYLILKDRNRLLSLWKKESLSPCPPKTWFLRHGDAPCPPGPFCTP